jgi:hypothetical protein
MIFSMLDSEFIQCLHLKDIENFFYKFLDIKFKIDFYQLFGI